MVAERTIGLDRRGLLVVVFFIIALIITGRLFHLQIFKAGYFDTVAADQHRIEQVLLQSRGEIYMHDFKGQSLTPLVLNRNLSLVYAVPSQITNPKMTAKLLANIFEDEHGQCGELLPESATEELILKCETRKKLEEDIYHKVKKEDDPYEPLRHEATEEQVDKIKALNLDGIYFEDEWVRFYPEADRAAQVSGFLGYQQNRRVGQYGIEGYWEEDLAGEAGKLWGNKDLFGRLIPVAEQELVAARDGENMVLTLDKVIQNKAYEIIKEAVEGYGAVDGSLMVMDPLTGDIKAMVGYPSFDPNDYSQVEDIEVYKNFNISQAYEPGSIFKIITMAAGLESGTIGPDTTYVDEGYVILGDHKIRNADNEEFGEINMTEVLEHSVNSGAIHVVLETGKKTFRKYVQDFGFGQVKGIGLDGEVAGDISSLDKRGDIYMATASYGQGITVTPIQMAAALATIVNNGRSVQPRIVERVGDQEVTATNNGQQVISEETAQVLKAMMVSVVKNGQGSKAQVPGYYIGGKTGTAEIAEAGGYSDENIHSFIGFGPLDKSKFVIMVKLSKPEWGRFSAVTAAPTFQKMAAFLLQYYQLAPEYTE
jgi:cell division protein FtsI/penicillin-binding protein 2